MALIAIGAFMLALITGATAMMFAWKPPAAPAQASGKPAAVERS